LGPFQSHQNISLNWRDFHRCVTWDKHQWFLHLRRAFKG
jgi:hypothetical protein